MMMIIIVWMSQAVVLREAGGAHIMFIRISRISTMTITIYITLFMIMSICISMPSLGCDIHTHARAQDSLYNKSV